MLSSALRLRLDGRSKPVITALHLAGELANADVRAFEARLLEWRDRLILRLEGLEAQARLEGLLDFFYGELAFAGDESHFTAEGCLLTQVIRERRGGATALGMILLYLAEGAEVPLKAINFPRFLVLRSPLKQGAFLDPHEGRWHPLAELELRLRGTKGNWKRLQDKHLQALDDNELLVRLCSALKGALVRDGLLFEAAKVAQALVELKPGDPYLIRDRGYVLYELDCLEPAASDLNHFVEQCPDDPACELLRRKLAAMDDIAPTLH
ncbi:tetratricopeptide repeat protein [Gallaecimonas sp. GXIMD4217]|uniref:transglutaminase family protein n=1 Tax=Gallaecimonas sp. GXIMD4217 TaxID=3131927 RepID=UPI00311AF0FC